MGKEPAGFHEFAQNAWHAWKTVPEDERDDAADDGIHATKWSNGRTHLDWSWTESTSGFETAILGGEGTRREMIDMRTGGEAFGAFGVTAMKI